ncbi:transposase, IS605 OrfB family [Caldicellulosiruptor obsidiansis OB47]|uniref:Transposase, IS605 OrfB family n=1 Tax=Caldicellulosiruptor obsidiansis (strain ATCC BAA-2073 / JCM 16842 / OB47) TaxID=608506 RepID=D9TGJ1_CALOO|nr:RNA-guided endonuclease TnpB family protein [Caldicellulosiruptor obsidiansis]ADL43311.1 transposase, IS605 OrfB family [Caldicellulosiruptor obsidiansis OB47]
MDKTYILPVPEKYQSLAIELSIESGKIYSKAVSFLKKMNKKGIKISRKTFDRYMEWWIHQKDFVLHSQSKQAAYQQAWTAYQATLQKIKKAKKKGKDTSGIRLPYRNKKYNKVVFKESAIHLKGNALMFSNKKGEQAIVLRDIVIKATLKYAELIYHTSKKRYYLHVVVEVKEREIEKGKGVLAVDVGVIHPMVCFDGKNVLIYNGGILNAKLRYRNKKFAEFQQKLSMCKKGSKRFRKLENAKREVLRKLNNQIRDVLEKYTSHLIGYCVKNGIGTIVLGDLKGIRNGAKHGKVSNQKVHQWMFRKVARRIEEKARFVRIDVVYIKENSTSQVCPVCGSRNKPENRNYECRNCSFRYHRDGVGAINIYRKYTGGRLLVVGQLACPTGVRFEAHLCCPTRWNVHPVGKTA